MAGKISFQRERKEDHRMKKWLTALLAAAMVLSLAACGKDGGEETTAESTTAAEETESAQESESAAEEAEEPSDYVSAFDLGDINEYVELGEYKNIRVTAQDTEVTDEEVEEELNSQVENSVPDHEKITEGTVAEGDVANIDFVGRMDGEEFDGGSGEDFNLTIGSGQFIEGFESGLIGKSIGETVVLDLSFPEDYSKTKPELNGKPVEFTVTINYVQGEEIPSELNDAFVQRITGGEYTNVEDYRAYVREDLENSKLDTANTNRINEAWSQIMENATFKKDSPELYQYIYDSQMEQLESSIALYGMDMESYLTAMDMTQEELEEQLSQYAEDNARGQLVLRAIVETEHLDLTDAEYESSLAELAEESGMAAETLKSSYPKSMLMDILRQEKVEEFLQNNMVTD